MSPRYPHHLDADISLNLAGMTARLEQFDRRMSEVKLRTESIEKRTAAFVVDRADRAERPALHRAHSGAGTVAKRSRPRPITVAE